jgi:hypothetical protein
MNVAAAVSFTDTLVTIQCFVFKYYKYIFKHKNDVFEIYLLDRLK